MAHGRPAAPRTPPAANVVDKALATSKKKKKKRLPSDFAALLEKGDLAALHCPDELARWLVARGADLGAGDARGETPLHARANRRQAKVDVLLELGAVVDATDTSSQTPLHAAAFRQWRQFVQIMTRPQDTSPIPSTVPLGENDTDCGKLVGTTIPNWLRAETRQMAAFPPNWPNTAVYV